MKKIAKKLVLSAVSLGLVAATLSTTTFAWYVSNTEASVSGVNGKIEGEAIGGNLLVAQNAPDLEGPDQPGNFTSSITLSTSGKELNPVTLSESKWYDQEGTDQTASNPYIEYKFWILSTEATTVNVTSKLKNSTTSFIEQTVYNAASLPNSGTAAKPAQVGDKFKVDAVRALKCVITGQDATSSTDMTLKESPAELANGGLVGLDATYTSPEECVWGGDANQYFKAMLGYAAYGTTGYVAGNQGTAGTGASVEMEDASFSSITVTKGVPKEIVIRIWLEGTCENCWDSCRGQDFELNFTFTTGA